MSTSKPTKSTFFGVFPTATKFDVAIGGGGPAGSAAAIRCAQAGAKVVLVERSPFPRHRPGESLHPGIEPLLRQLGVWQQVERAGFVRHAGLRVRAGDRETFKAFGADEDGTWMGLQAWRADFDEILLQKARDLGVLIMQPCGVREAITSADRVVGFESDQGRIFADFTVDAAGCRHWLANELSLAMPTASPQLLAQYGYMEGDWADARDAPLLIADAEGWAWVARVRERTYQWTRLSVGRNSQKLTAPGIHSGQIGFEGLAAVGHVCGADVTWRCVVEPAGPGYFLCGDAAAVLDPAASHGVLKAVMSGIYVGHLIEQIRTGVKSAAGAATEYSDWLTSWFRHDVAALRAHYADLGIDFNGSRDQEN